MHTIQTLIMVVTMRRSGVIAQARGVEADVGQTEEGGRKGWLCCSLPSHFWKYLFDLSERCLSWQTQRWGQGGGDDTWTKLATTSEYVCLARERNWHLSTSWLKNNNNNNDDKTGITNNMPGPFIHTHKKKIFNELIPGRREDSDIPYMHTADSHIFFLHCI